MKSEKNSYYIAFDTKDFPGCIPGKNIRGVKVTLEYEIISDMKRKLSVNLCEHPLYPYLEASIASNQNAIQKGSN
jgi:hypothetical protein